MQEIRAMPCNLFRQRRRRFAGKRARNRTAQYSQRNARRVCAESSGGLREALLIVASFLMFFFCLLPRMYLFRGWQAARYCCWAQSVGAIRAPGKILPAGNSLSGGTPRRWGLFGENDQEQINNFHSVLSTWSTPHTGSPTLHISRPTNRYRYLSRPPRSASGGYLSLHDEVKNFPLQHWLRSRLSLRVRCWCCLCCYSGSR